MANDIFKGLRVVELSTHVAVPYCGRAFADMGAEVIKIEPPKGESYRAKMSMLFQLPNKPDADFIFTPYNVNKKSLCLNLKDPAAVEVFLKLMETTDIFITNTREKALDKLGIGLETLHEKFPRLIIGNVSGFGPKGPDKDNPGYDATSFWARSGALSEFSYADDNHLFKPFYGFGDAVGAAQLTVGILSALYNREKTGKGDIVRMALMAAGLWNNVGGMIRARAGHHFPKDFDEPILPLDNFYKTKDGKWILISEENWGSRYQYYFDLFGTPELNDDPNWNSMMAYVNPKTTAEQVHFFQEKIAEHTAQEIIDVIMGKADTVCAIVPDHDEILTDEQAWANDFIRKMNTKDGTELTIANVPYKFAEHGVIDEISPAPQLGQETAAILAELGYDEAAITKMVEGGAVVAYKE